MDIKFDDQYWSSRYRQNQTGWNIGTISEPIKQYLDQILNKNIRILIPGAGNAYEAIYAFDLGFTNIHILDFADEPIKNFRKTCPNFPANHIHQQDFFAFKGEFDLILEQTFFCAIDPSLRADYTRHSYNLLKSGGKVAGVLFNRQFPEGPPFGGSAEEYRKIFEKVFDEVILEPCYNSIPERQGSELFIRLLKY
jgi:methyl halide transferase